jgi:hypothetical protein
MTVPRGDIYALGSGELGMAQYRIYTVGSDGHFVGFEPLVCSDDTRRSRRRKRLVSIHDIEVWSGLRFVIRLSPESS